MYHQMRHMVRQGFSLFLRLSQAGFKGERDVTQMMRVVPIPLFGRQRRVSIMICGQVFFGPAQDIRRLWFSTKIRVQNRNTRIIAGQNGNFISSRVQSKVTQHSRSCGLREGFERQLLPAVVLKYRIGEHLVYTRGLCPRTPGGIFTEKKIRRVFPRLSRMLR